MVAMVTWLPSNRCYGGAENLRKVVLFKIKYNCAPERSQNVLYLFEKRKDRSFRNNLPYTLPISQKKDMKAQS